MKHDLWKGEDVMKTVGKFRFGEALSVGQERREKIDRIRNLNDDLRKQRLGGHVVITAGIAALDPLLVKDIIAAVTNFDDFTPDNDPYGERDCGSMAIWGVSVIWKIDYYDLSRRLHSPDPSDRDLTSRVLTIMRADEY